MMRGCLSSLLFNHIRVFHKKMLLKNHTGITLKLKIFSQWRKNNMRWFVHWRQCNIPIGYITPRYKIMYGRPWRCIGQSKGITRANLLWLANTLGVKVQGRHPLACSTQKQNFFWPGMKVIILLMLWSFIWEVILLSTTSHTGIEGKCEEKKDLPR